MNKQNNDGQTVNSDKVYCVNTNEKLRKSTCCYNNMTCFSDNNLIKMFACYFIPKITDIFFNAVFKQEVYLVALLL